MKKPTKRRLTRKDMMRLWPTNVCLWTPRQMELWRLAK